MDVLNMSLEPTMAREIETKKLNLINPFNQGVIFVELKIAITFTVGEIESVVLVRAD